MTVDLPGGLAYADKSVSFLAGLRPQDALDTPLSTLLDTLRERFGGSFAGAVGCVEKHQRLGFGWIRWRPHMNGRDHLPDKPQPGQPWESLARSLAFCGSMLH